MSENKGEEVKHKIQMEGTLSGHKIREIGKEQGTSGHGEECGEKTEEEGEV